MPEEDASRHQKALHKLLNNKNKKKKICVKDSPVCYQIETEEYMN